MPLERYTHGAPHHDAATEGAIRRAIPFEWTPDQRAAVERLRDNLACARDSD